MAQLRNFVFTLNNPTVEDYESLMGLDYEYLIIVKRWQTLARIIYKDIAS